MFEYSNLELLSTLKEFKSFFHQILHKQVERQITSKSLLLEIGGVECIQNLTRCVLK